MPENERDFKGVWIPKEVWLDTRLSALDKMILTEIDSLDNSERGCYASNKHIADFCQCSEAKVSKSISLLIKLGYLYLQHFDGRQRELKSRFTKNNNLPCKNYEADCEKIGQSNTNNNTSINTENKDNIYTTEFEALWKLYPRKLGKPKALKSYEKARKKGTTYEEVEQGLKAYCKQIELQKTATEYIKHGSTWFNGECWNDEYDVSKKPLQKNGKNERYNVGEEEDSLDDLF